MRAALGQIGAGLWALAGAALLGACQPEEKVLKYKPFFTGLSGAEFTGQQPVNAGAGIKDPTQTGAEDKIIIEDRDGKRTLVCKSPRAVMMNLENLLDENTPEADELIVDQLFSEKTRQNYQSKGQDPRVYVQQLHKQRKAIAKTFSRMPMAEHTPTVIIDQPGDNVWIIRLTGAPTRDLKYTRIWVRLEAAEWKLMWID